MLPEKLLRLACAEFPTFDLAIAANPYGRRELCWREPVGNCVLACGQEIPRPIPFLEHRLTVQQLPSGFWAWVPSHPEDLAIVAEHRKEQFEFSSAQYLYCQIKVVSEDYQQTRICDDIKRELKQEIGCRFLELMQSDKIYKTAISFREGRSTNFPGMFCVQITLIYSEADSATSSGLSFAPVSN